MNSNFQQNSLTHSDLMGLQQSVYGFFSEKSRRAERNLRLKRGEHWAPEERQRIIEQGREPYSMSLVAHKLNTILAMQRAANEPNALDSIFRGFDSIESDVFDEGLTLSYGAVEIGVEGLPQSPHPKVKKLPHGSLTWDVNASDFMLRDALFMTKREHRYRYEIEREHGNLGNLPPAVQKDFSLTGTTTTYFIKSHNASHAGPNDVITVFTHYHRVTKTYYYVVFTDGEGASVANRYETRKEAEQALREFQVPYLLNHGVDPGGIVIKREEDTLEKYVFTAYGIHSYELLNQIHFPFAVYRSFHHGKEFWTLTDLLADPQRFLDRIYMQIDFGFGKDIKNLFQANVNALAEIETPAKAMEKASKTGGIIWTRSNEEVLKPLRSAGVNPQFLQLGAIMQTFIEDLAGGRSFQGLGEGANESGRAILAKQQQGLVAAGLYLDNLALWRAYVQQLLLEQQRK